MECEEFPAKSPKSIKSLQLIQFCSPDESVENFLHAFLNTFTYFPTSLRLKLCTDEFQLVEWGSLSCDMGSGICLKIPHVLLRFQEGARIQLSPISPKWLVWLLPKAHNAFVASWLDPVMAKAHDGIWPQPVILPTACSCYWCWLRPRLHGNGNVAFFFSCENATVVKMM